MLGNVHFFNFVRFPVISVLTTVTVLSYLLSICFLHSSLAFCLTLCGSQNHMNDILHTKSYGRGYIPSYISIYLSIHIYVGSTVIKGT